MRRGRSTQASLRLVPSLADRAKNLDHAISYAEVSNNNNSRDVLSSCEGGALSHSPSPFTAASPTLQPAKETGATLVFKATH